MIKRSYSLEENVNYMHVDVATLKDELKECGYTLSQIDTALSKMMSKQSDAFRTVGGIQTQLDQHLMNIDSQTQRTANHTDWIRVILTALLIVNVIELFW